MLLAADIGNTRAKFAVFKNNALLELFVAKHAELAEVLNDVFVAYPQIQHVVASSVNVPIDKIPFPKSVAVHQVSRLWKFPFQNNYQTPETLGVDRLILVSGAVLLFPKQTSVIIDAGTCITYDVVDHQNQYHGGAISAGLQMRYKALHHYTANLPLLEPEFPDTIMGNTTATSIHNGICNGVVYELEGFINTYHAAYPNFITILTGGDANFLATRLKNTIFALPNFLLESMNALYNFNQE
jgi:type III pantothenate kinase